MCPVRFLKVAGHLGKQFIIRDADIDSKAQFFSDLIPDLLRQDQRPLPILRRNLLCQIQKGLIDRHLLKERCVLRQDFHKGAGIFPIGLKI